MSELVKAVRDQLSDDPKYVDQMLSDVHGHGADGGFGGFVYYADTVPFAMLHLDEIRECLVEDASDLGMRSAASMIADFGCLKDQGLSDDDINAVIWKPTAAFVDHKDDVTALILNALAWYALEKVATDFVSQQEEIV
jgi:hypothetical protein